MTSSGRATDYIVYRRAREEDEEQLTLMPTLEWTTILRVPAAAAIGFFFARCSLLRLKNETRVDLRQVDSLAFRYHLGSPLGAGAHDSPEYPFPTLKGLEAMVPDTHTQFLRKGLTRWLMIVIFAAALVLAGCNKKKVVTGPPPPPPPPAAPTVSLSATPDTIKAGESSTLTWQTQNATDITLDGKAVDANGSKTVSPDESTTFRLIAKGAGRTEEAAARITVTQPLPPPPLPAGPRDAELFAQNIKHVFFDYDKFDIRADQQSTVEANAQWLMQHPNVSFTIEGHCDERGSAEYNVALGDNRANAVKAALIQAGVSGDRIRTISYGKEKPFCSDANEACWQQNRRGYFAYGK